MTAKVSDRVTDLVLARITSGEWAVGSKLPGERVLAQELGVSRVSVRAAFQALKSRGYLDTVQGGGSRVIATQIAGNGALSDIVSLSPSNFYELAEIRAIIEVWAARRAAESATPEQIQELLDVVAEATGDDKAYPVQHDIRFHLAVAKASNSEIYQYLTTMMRGIFHQMLSREHYDVFTSPADYRTILGHHRSIAQAIKDRDATAAALAMQVHLSWVLAGYRAKMSKLKSDD